MDFTSAFLLGLIQGLTEFLPVSSSGHLVLAQRLLGWDEPEIFFDICLHIGTFLAVLLVFFGDILVLVKGGAACLFSRGPFKWKAAQDGSEKIFLLIVLGTVPAVAVGLFARSQLEMLFASITAVSINLFITGALLWLTRYARFSHPRKTHQTRWRDALLVGVAQSLALAPGISRSGSTISAGLFLGLDRDWAARMSFLLFVPAVLGALTLEMFKVELHSVALGPVLLGTITAGVTGYVALKLLLRLVRRGSFYVFAPYCWLVGLICLVWGLLDK